MVALVASILFGCIIIFMVLEILVGALLVATMVRFWANTRKLRNIEDSVEALNQECQTSNRLTRDLIGIYSDYMKRVGSVIDMLHRKHGGF